LHLDVVPRLESFTFSKALRLWITHLMLLTWFEETVPRLEASEAFRAAHNPAEDNDPLYLDHRQVQGL
jgi:hypothetical protein